MRYVVRADWLNLRVASSPTAAVIDRVPAGALLDTDRLIGRPDLPDRTGYDDPATPQPARRSSDWARVVRYRRAAGSEWIDCRSFLYAAYEWLEPVPDRSRLTFVSPPRIPPERFGAILLRAKSPAAVESAACYQACLDRGIDPAIALAFFKHESSYGTAGLARTTLNWGNIRRSQGRGEDRVIPGRGPFAHYSSWADSLMDWCDLILNRYVARGLDTVDLAIPVYAPSSDGNAPARYIAAVRDAVDAWDDALTTST